MWQPILMINGYLVSVLGLAMLIPASVAFNYKESAAADFLQSSMITLFFGLSLFLANRTKIKHISIQQGYLLTVFSWFLLTLLGTMPFVFSGDVSGFADALFESASGITATGATVMTNLDGTSKAILLWRSILTGMGGIGIVIFAVALLPFLGIGGMRIFQRENSDMNDKILPRFNYIAKEIIFIYVFLGLSCMIALNMAGMDWFDALNHAMTSVATGGFSTKDASVAYYDSAAIEMVLSLFMVLGAIPMTFYIIIFLQKDSKSFRTAQVVCFLKVLAVYILGTAFYLWINGQYDFVSALRYSIFNVISVVTTTGYASTDYAKWGSFAAMLFIVFSLTGGCTGSTSGSIKILRWQVVAAFLKKSLLSATDPNRVVPIKIGNIKVDNAVAASVYIFLSAYLFCLVILTLLVGVTGVDIVTAFSAVVACITNVGPGIGDVVGPVGNYSSLSDFAKYVLSFAMLLGRLDILTVLVVFTKSFWQK